MKRREYLFLYDVTYANPNGDPNDENKPRIDEESGRCIVTDVRLKRTIRDYLHEYKGEEIFVREIENDDGTIQDAKQRAKDFLKGELGKEPIPKQKEAIAEAILLGCIDVRLFGATIPLELKDPKGKKVTSSITFTGPVQFGMGESLHRVKLEFIKGTGAFASEAGKEQKTFREEWVLPYALIGFWGVANEHAARYTKMSQSDLDKLTEAMWEGTKNLLSRSKMGQLPRLLVEIEYKEPFFIGELHHLVGIKSQKSDEELRDVNDYLLDIGALNEALQKYSHKIDRVRVRKDSRLRFAQEPLPIMEIEEV